MLLNMSSSVKARMHSGFCQPMSSHQRFSCFLVFKCFWPFNVSFPFFGRTNIVSGLSSFSLEIFLGFSCSLAIFVGFSRSLKKIFLGLQCLERDTVLRNKLLCLLCGEKGTSFLCFWGLKVGHWSCSCFAFFDPYFSLKKKSSFFFPLFPIFFGLSGFCLFSFQYHLDA